MDTTNKEKQLPLFDDKTESKNDGFGKGSENRVIMPRVISAPTKVFTNNIGRSRASSLRWESPDWDLAECGRILDSVSGHRFTSVKLDGKLRIVSFEDLWDILSVDNTVVINENREYIYIDNLEVLSGKLSSPPDPSESMDRPRGQRFCCVDGCTNKHRANGYCSTHFDIIRKSQDKKLPPIIKGVWKKCNFITRHKVTKLGYTFLQKHGCTEVTADHSLITIDESTLTTFSAAEQKQIACLTDLADLRIDKIDIDLSEYVDHPYITKHEAELIYSKKVKLKNDGYKNNFAKIIRFINKEHLSDFLAILGAYVSEGSVTKNTDGSFYDFRIAQADRLWLEDLQEKFQNVFPNINCKIINTNKDNSQFALSCNRQIIATLFASLCGYQSQSKRIPEFVFSLDKESQDVFKRYMIEGDGSCYNWGYNYTTKSLELASGWSFLLRLQNINHSFSYKVKDDTVYYSINTAKYYEKRTQFKTRLLPFSYDDEYVYDLEVEDTHNFIDLAGQVLLHNTESYVRRAFRNKKNLFTKEGYELVGAIPNRTQYIKRRLKQMEMATGLPFKILISQTVWSLIRTHNAFWVKVRDDKASGGRIRKDAKNRTLKPVAGYFPMSPETVRFKRDEYGKLRQYAQEVYGKEPKTFHPDDIIHFYFDKREGFSVGTPSLVSVKDDIRALRRIEENVELLVYQHLFPLFHYKVGTEKEPAKIYPGGGDEVQDIEMKVAMMPSDGCWVTPERHSIEAIGAESPPVAVEKVIEHFKQRIFTGLGNSSVDMGEGGTANKSTAQTMSRNLIDDTKADQKEFASLFEAFVIRELMLESTFPDSTLFDEENEVYLRFKEIDLEARQSKENHLADIFIKNAITHDEMRTGMGYEPFEGDGWPTVNSKSKMFTKGDGDFARTNYGLIERDKVVLQSLDEPGTDASQAETKSRTTQNKTKPAGGNAVANKNQPANQHGKRTSAKINKDSFSNIGVVPSLSVIFVQNPPIQTIYDILTNDVNNQIRNNGLRINELKLLVDSAFSQGKDKLIMLAQRAYRIGLQDTGASVWEVKSEKADAKINDHVSRYIDKLHNDVTTQLKRNTINSPALTVENALSSKWVFDTLRHRTSMIDNSEIMRAYNYGKASGYRVCGFEKMTSKRHGTKPCEICDDHPLKYKNEDAIIYEELPPLHPHCTCTMEKE